LNFEKAATFGIFAFEMASEQEIALSDYTYELPDEKIARFPVNPRHASKLLVYKNGKISESIFLKLDEAFEHAPLLVFNNTKVVRARMVFTKASGGKIELFCLQPANGIIWEEALAAKRKIELECLVGGISKWKEGPLEKKINIGKREIRVSAHYKANLPDCKQIELDWHEEDISFSEILDKLGDVPLPPYLKRQSTQEDTQNYQTCYARVEGSVAAPTAGLHFTPEVFESIAKKGSDSLYVTLHVGAGTFKPIKSAKIEEHTMHEEWMVVNMEMLEKLIRNEKTLIAVGTTSVRFLETLYWLGVMVHKGEIQDLKQCKLSQWKAYELNSALTAKESLKALLSKKQANGVSQFYCTTQIMIKPGYKFKMIEAIITNFHQPSSTLLLLIGAIVGSDWKNIYDYALSHDYRFLSYGDSSLLWVKSS